MRCPGRLHPLDNFSEPMPRGCAHSHPPDVEDGMIRQAVSRMRERAATENHSIQQIYQEEANWLSSSAVASAMVPVLHSVDTSLYRARRQRFPPLPSSRAEIVIPHSLHFTESGENFVLLQLQNNDIIAFGMLSDFDTLCNATHVYMDRTFDACPQLYRQLFTLHAFFEERQVPLLYVLMNSKERVAYISLFDALKDLAITRGQQFSPQLILSDFESGLIPAIQAEFPEAHHQGCYFHFTQAIWKTVQHLGLAQHYTEDRFVQVTIRRLMALGFLPIEDVRFGLELIRVSLMEQEFVDMGHLLEYFQRQCLHRFVNVFKFPMVTVFKEVSLSMQM
ncbi:hypothetical protein R1flu_010335 [Riccia fluitans]|uniref:MULE transposase domain-containing protein n=1 Tax=Riccia fluitans TaxID=41844 RepID=A0ABD1Z4P7_9MARC